VDLDAVLHFSLDAGEGKRPVIRMRGEGRGEHLPHDTDCREQPMLCGKMGCMTNSRPRIGLTGGIASGKSTVADLLRRHGAVIIDADRIVRDLQEPGQAGLTGIVDAFGEGMLDSDGRLDRPKLGALVFNDDQARERLNAIIHPLVRAEAARLKEQAGESLVIEDIPLLVETGQAGDFDRVIVVQAPHEERVRRMVADRGMTADDAESRIAAQASDAARAEVATDLIVNDADRAALASQVDALSASLDPRAD
jgi:dephospho-CoA kinase